MEAFKSLIRNIALFIFIGAIPSIGWASGYVAAFSWTTFFLFLGGFFCVLWLKERQNHHVLRNILLTHEDAWAVWEGDQAIDKSSSFSADSLQSFKKFIHFDNLQEVELAIDKLVHTNLPFKINVNAAEGQSVYSLSGKHLEGRIIFWLRNITESVSLERFYTENLTKKETLLTKLQAVLDLLPIPIWLRDQDQRITYCNHAYSEAVGESPQVIQNEGIELIQPRNAHLTARKALNTHESQFFESTAVLQEERRSFRICEIPNSAEQGTLGIAFDITSLKEAQKEIKNLMDAHDEVLAHLSTAIAIYDAAGTLQYYNQAYVNLNNFDEDFLNTHPGLDEVLEDLRSRRQLPEYADFPAYKKMCLHQLKEQMEPREDLMHLPDERTLRNFSAPHPMGGLLFIYEDVTNYLSLERKNKALFDSYQATLDNLFEGVVVIGSDNRVKVFNPSFRRLWNFDAEDVDVGQHFALVVDKLQNFFDYEGDWEVYKAQFIDSVTDRVPKSGQLKRKDGIILNFGYLPLPNGNHFLSYADITDTYRVQQALEERNEALVTADLLKSEFIGPLNTIIGFTELLHNKNIGELNEKQVDYVEGILNSSTKLLHLIKNLIELHGSRVELSSELHEGRMVSCLLSRAPDNNKITDQTTFLSNFGP